jgi:hypothetical protein
MTTFLAIVAGIATFLVTQFIGALAIALLGTANHTIGFIANYGPTKLLLRLALWGGSAWLGMLAFSAIG